MLTTSLMQKLHFLSLHLSCTVLVGGSINQKYTPFLFLCTWACNNDVDTLNWISLIICRSLSLNCMTGSVSIYKQLSQKWYLLGKVSYHCWHKYRSVSFTAGWVSVVICQHVLCVSNLWLKGRRKEKRKWRQDSLGVGDVQLRLVNQHLISTLLPNFRMQLHFLLFLSPPSSLPV